MLEYISNNGEGNCIDVQKILTASAFIIEEDNLPYCFIKFFMSDRTRFEWRYESMKVRDFDLLEINRLKHEFWHPKVWGQYVPFRRH